MMQTAQWSRCVPRWASQVVSSRLATAHTLGIAQRPYRFAKQVPYQSFSTQTSRVAEKFTDSPNQQTSEIVAQYVGPMRLAYSRLKLFSLSSLSVAAIFAPIFLLYPGQLEMAARLGISLTTLGASSVSTALISWIGAPYVGHMSLRRSPSGTQPAHYITDGINDLMLDETPSDPVTHANEAYYLEMATLSWNMRSLKTIVYSPSLLRSTSRPLATWELPSLPPPLLLDQGVDQQSDYTVSKLVAETIDVTKNKVVGRWWARWRVSPTNGDAMEFQGTCEPEKAPVRYFYVDETKLGPEWQVLE
ncbi:hypothetical protein MPSI1_003670 [Malassezia psittaci]|uniref:Uncharacterized protein n=1 Tax=Malassezia psittaci TaxID=1821823 RepID=A0AAF0FDY9_9BASI|nr:hypothetical protein MPSI1_003670 [Malassezia psittaci]